MCSLNDVVVSMPMFVAPMVIPSMGMPHIVCGSWSGSAFDAAAVNDTTNKTASKIVCTFFILLTSCFNIYFTPFLLGIHTIFRYNFNSVRTYELNWKNILLTKLWLSFQISFIFDSLIDIRTFVCDSQFNYANSEPLLIIININQL